MGYRGYKDLGIVKIAMRDIMIFVGIIVLKTVLIYYLT